MKTTTLSITIMAKPPPPSHDQRTTAARTHHHHVRHSYRSSIGGVGPQCSAAPLEQPIMDTFAALALATDQATEALLDRKPDKKIDPLFTVDMIKQIVGQSRHLISVWLCVCRGSRVRQFGYICHAPRWSLVLFILCLLGCP
jgi:hypothetical protein